MSKFLKALDQAQHDRALLQQARERSVAGASLERRIEATTPASAPGPDPEPTVIDGVAPHLVSLLTPVSFEAEQYRTLRHIVEQARRVTDVQLLAVSAPAAGDGKTTIAINLAGALAQAPEARVLLVDADLRHPAIVETLGLRHSNLPGLVDATLDPGTSLRQVARFLPRFNLSVVASGRPPASPYELLKSPRLAELFQHARREYDYVVVDTPPLVALPDCRILAKHVDGFLLVVTAHKTPRRLLEAAFGAIEPAKVVGLVFNGDDDVSAKSSGYVATASHRSGSARGWWRAAAAVAGRAPRMTSVRNRGVA